MKEELALSNLQTMLATFADTAVQPASNPGKVVANWKGTTLYKKSSFKGRMWQFIHWTAGTSENVLQKTIAETAKIAHQSLQQKLKQQEEAIKMINGPGVLGSFWTKHTVSEMQTKLADTVRYRSLVNAIQWAKPEGVENLPVVEEQQIEIAMKKMGTAAKLAGIWARFGADISITLLYRELQSTYPTTQEELEKRRDNLQRKTYGEDSPIVEHWYGDQVRYGEKTKCPEELLYGPLVAVAKQLATNQELPRKELTQLFRDLMETSSSPNGETLLDLAAFLKDPKNVPVPGQLPSSVAKAVQGSIWVEGCGLEVTKDENRMISCRREWVQKRRLVQTPVYHPWHRHSGSSSSGPSFTHTIQEYVQKRHIKRHYCYEKRMDGSETVDVREFVREVGG